jgi:hypothetical protein
LVCIRFLQNIPAKLSSTWNADSLQSSTKEELLQAMNLEQKTCNKLQKKLAA